MNKDYKGYISYILYQCKHGISFEQVLRNLGFEEKKMEDLIEHPKHYCEGRKFEPKDVIRDWDLNFNLGNAVKYISRNGRKKGESALKDLQKARQYLNFEIAALTEEIEKNNDVEDLR